MPVTFTENLAPNKTLWAKFGHIDHFYVLGKDSFCIGSGCNLLMTDLLTKEEVRLTCNNQKHGEGVDCYIGHRTLNIFAYSEALTPPRIFVRTFPELDIINMLEGGAEQGYHCLVFTEADFLIGLGKYPNFIITVWNWRTGDKVVSAHSSLLCDKQMIKCNQNHNMPIHFAHIGLFESSLSIWDLYTCGKQCLLMEHKVSYRKERPHIPGTKNIEPPYFTNGFWTTDGGFFTSNSEGNIYMVSSDYFLDEVIRTEAIGRGLTYLCWFNGGIINFGPDDYFRHYKKSGTWYLNFTLKSECNYKKLIVTRSNFFLGLTTQHDVHLYNDKLKKFESMGKRENGFSDVCLIYPMGLFCVTLARKKELSCWHIESGKRMDTLSLKGTILTLVENPEYPYVAVGFMHGLLELISVYDPFKMEELASFLLSDRPIDKIYFTEIGNLLVTCDTYTGQFFIIEGTPGTKMHVIATVDAKHQIADFILVASKTCLRLFAIFVTSDQYVAGNRLVRFCITSNKSHEPVIKDYILEHPEDMFSKLCATTRPNRDRVFYALPFSKKGVYEIETKRGEDEARIIQHHTLGHQMRKIRLVIDRLNSVSCGYDGLVILHNRHLDEGQGLATIMPHHRMLCGVRKAYVDPLRTFILSFGRDRSLVCTKLLNPVEEEDGLAEELKSIMEGVHMELMFKIKTHGFSPKGELVGKTWIEAERLSDLHFEKLQCQEQRKEIWDEVQRIQAIAQRLLTENIEGPENEYLDYQDFNMDRKLKEKLTAESHELCTRTQTHLENLIAAQDKVTKWIKKYCWDNMEVQGKAIWAIFGNFDVQNYVLLPTKNDDVERMQLVQARREIETNLSAHDIFEPWLPIAELDLEKKLNKCPEIADTDIVAVSAINIIDADEESEGKIDEETFTAFAGSIAHAFIPFDKLEHYNQYELQSFLQTNYQTTYIQRDKILLKEYLNRDFEKLLSQKEREMYMVNERNVRLRHILSELNYFNDNKYQVQVNDPEWKQTENPELILKVGVNEVTVTPYISPSQQAILDAMAAEEERIRLLLLADDFRERALMVMMNGVLEIRWEDELRKEVPIPACMIEKEPENFVLEDLQAIKDYEEKCKFLLNERERYRKILEAEYAKVGNTLRESVRKFNGRLADLMILKMKVDAAIQQENLKVNRMLLSNLERIQLNYKENCTLKQIEENEGKIEELHKIILNLHENIVDIKNQIEVAQEKDKIVEKSFRREFQDASPVVQDMVNKLFKKRPKTNIRNITSVAMLHKLTICLITRTPSLILNMDCLDFLKAMDALDFSSGVTNIVDDATYSIVCRSRRQKIEIELKLKVLQMELTDGETTLNLIHKQSQIAHELHQKLNHDVANIRKEKIIAATDMKIQLVLKEGIVEVETTGDLSDYDDSILVARKEVEDINKIILNTGNKKLKAMRDNMNFHRSIMAKEWEHRRMKMRIEDYKYYLNDIQSVKVTKEIQSFLKSRSRGESPDKAITFEQEIQMIRKSFERIIYEKKYKVQDLQKQINIIKKNNAKLDQIISDVNVDVCEYQCEINPKLEKREQDIIKMRIATLLKRSKLVTEIQENHNEILLLQTQLEILRLRTYPTLKYNVID